MPVVGQLQTGNGYGVFSNCRAARAIGIRPVGRNAQNVSPICACCIQDQNLKKNLVIPAADADSDHDGNLKARPSGLSHRVRRSVRGPGLGWHRDCGTATSPASPASTASLQAS
jgi:hypothetical protein